MNAMHFCMMIKAFVAVQFGLRYDDLGGDGRVPEVQRARRIAIALIHDTAPVPIPYATIGRAFHRRPATIQNLVTVVRREEGANPFVRSDMDGLRRIIRRRLEELARDLPEINDDPYDSLPRGRVLDRFQHIND